MQSVPPSQRQLPAAPPQVQKQLPATQNSNSFAGGSLLQSLTPKEFANYAITSGYFREAGITTEAHAIMRIAYGEKLGIDPMTALSSVYIVKGKPRLEPSQIWTDMNNHARYGVEIVQLDDDRCILQITFDGKPKGNRVEFTYDEACGLELVARNAKIWKNNRQRQLLYKCAHKAQVMWAPDLYKMHVSATDEVDADSVTEVTNDAATQALASAGKRRRGSNKEDAKEDSSAEQQTQDVASGAVNGLGTTAPEQQTIEDAQIIEPEPEQEPKSEISPPPTAVTEDLNRAVTAQEIANGLAGVKSNGWDTMRLTVYCRGKYYKSPLTALTLGEFREALIYAAQYKPGKQ